MLRDLPDCVTDLWAGLLWTVSAVFVVEGFSAAAGYALLVVAMAWLARTGVRIARDASGAATQLLEVLDEGTALSEARRLGVVVAVSGAAGAIASAAQLLVAAL